MSRFGVAFAVLLIVVLTTTACNSHTDLPYEPQRFIHDGQPLYTQHCAGCHQEDGMGKPGNVPRLAGNPIVTLQDPIPLIDTVVNGKGNMPAFGDALDDVEIAEILSYVRNSWGNQAPAVSNRQIP